MKKNVRIQIGIDEAGRGPLAGPVVVCALAFLKPTARKLMPISCVRDSKQMSARVREEWYQKIVAASQRGDIAFTVAFSSAAVIDRIGIVPAIKDALVMALARLLAQARLARLPISSAHARVLLDGALSAPAQYKNQKTIIRGDASVPAIALASVVAKVSRDRRMVAFAKKYPGYGFEKHKGYGTRAHYAAINKQGITLIHRKSFLTSIGSVYKKA